MHFHAGKTRTDRRGQAIREPKPGAKPNLDEKGNPLPWGEDQLREDVALLALDSTLHRDEDEMKKSPAEWVRAVMRREEVSKPIAAAITSGDGWVDLEKTECQMLKDHLAKLVIVHGLRTVGPVLEALEHPPQERPARKAAKAKPNGKGAEAAPAPAA
jgi:hypothetical protein